MNVYNTTLIHCTPFIHFTMQLSDSNGAETKKKEPINHFHLAQMICRSQLCGELFYSFELVSRNDGDGIYKTFFSQVRECNPAFYSLTWHNNKHKHSERIASLETLSRFPKNTLLHLAARGIKRDAVVGILDRVLELEITNLFIIRGDGDVEGGDFTYAIDLITFIIERYGEKFCIGVAGYPATHPDSISEATDLYHLMKKVEAGASFIITQIIFESKSFIDFVRDCKEYGIFEPIIPLVMPILSYQSFMKMENNCNLSIPKRLYNELETMKNDTNAVQEYGVELAVGIINDIISNRCATVFHLTTLNNGETTVKLCKKIEQLFLKHKK